MQTHEDRTHEFLDRIQDRAVKMRQADLSRITGGAPNEEALAEWHGVNGVHVKRLPDDEQGILRISIGGGIQEINVNYLVFRGDPHKCMYLLRAALAAMEEKLP